MIGPQVKDLPPHPRSLLKRKQPPVDVASAAKRATPTPSPTEIVDIVSDVCNYETISDYIQLFGEECEEAEAAQGSPASLESGYHTSGPQDADDEDSNLSWLLNFKVSSLFDPADDNPLPKKEEACSCAIYQKPAGKPPYTYTELIEKALKEQGELTVSGIYSWISSKFPYYSPSDDRWKNSVRHNLSINPHFRKGVKSRHGAGHLWTLSNEGVSPPPDSWVRRPTFTNSHAVAHDITRDKTIWRRRNLIVEEPEQRSQTLEIMDEAAIAAASIIEAQAEDHDTGTPALTRVAEQILSGVKRRVEVQYLVHDHNTNGLYWWVPDHAIVVIPSSSWSSPHPPEFLNPVSKEEIVSESGLDTGHCEAASSLLSDLNSELHLPDNLFSDELAFTCYPQL